MKIATKIKPKPGQESVWDYPRPPKIERTDVHIIVRFNEQIIADTRKAIRILETSHPPVYYLPPDDIRMQYLKRTGGSSYCEWKGMAAYYSLDVGGKTAEKVAWYYPDPVTEYLLLKDHVAFYAAPMDSCTVNGEIVKPQPGGFYGGWVTKDVVGPFKGGPGSMWW